MPSSCRSVSRVEIEIDARVLEVLEERVVGPRNALLDVRLGVREALDLAGLATEQTVKAMGSVESAAIDDALGSDLVASTLLNGVALGAASLEQRGALGGVTLLEAHG